MSSNGRILFDILKRQNLIIVNATEKCEGVITRYKKTARRVEQSLLDYFVVCSDFYQNILNKLGLSCAKLRPAWASYHLAFV